MDNHQQPDVSPNNPRMATPSQHKPTFLTLPRELRDMIYDLIFDNEAIDALHCATRHNKSIVLVCRQTYNEALKPYYRHSMFRFLGLGSASLWLERRSTEMRKEIRNVTFLHSLYGSVMTEKDVERRLDMKPGAIRWAF